MKILKIDLQNICAVERMTVDLTGNNMVVLVGSNGCGKSTLIGFIYWQLTGKLPDAHPTKADFRRILGKETPSPSGGVGTYEIGGHEVVLETWLHTRNWKMTVDGALVATTSTTVSAELAKLLRLEVNIIKQYGFIQQGTMRNVLFGQHAQRMEAFSKLIGANTAEPARDKIRLVMNAIESPDLSAEIVMARVSLVRVSEQVAETEKKRDAAKHIVDGIDADADRALVKRWEEGIAAEARLTQIATQLAAVKSEIVASVASLEEAAKNVEGWERVKEARRGPAAEAQAAIASHDAKVLQYQYFLVLKDEYSKLTAHVFPPLTISPLPELGVLPTEPVKPPRLDEAKSKVELLCANAHSTSQTLDSYTKRRESVCPICGKTCASCEAANGGPVDPEKVKELTRVKDGAWTSYDNAKTLIEKYERDCSLWSQSVAEAHRAHLALTQNVTNANERAKDSREAELLRYNNEMKRIADEFEKCAIREEPLLDMSSLQEPIELLVTAVAQHQHWDSTRASRALMHNNVQRRLDELAAEDRRLQGTFFDAPTTKQKEESEARIQIYQTNLASYDAIVDSLAGLSPLMEEQKQALEDLQGRQARNIKLRKFKSILESMRAVLHRDRLPARVIAGFMGLLVARINDHLPRFGAEFLIFTDGTEFMVRKATDGTEIAASNLSGGEACRWCVSFLLSVHQLFASDLGLLVLDEPSDGLDEAGQEAFGEAMVQLQDILRETHTQTVIATHSEPIASGAERVINVKELVEASSA